MSLDEDKLENLPSRERFPDHSRDRYKGWNFPFTRMARWLESKEGCPINEVISEYVNADWVAPEFRFAHKVYDYLQKDTYLEDGKIYFFSSGWRGNEFRSAIDEQTRKTIYVHPTTGLICVHRPKTQISWRKRWQEAQDAKFRALGDYHQLNKTGGIWYEVRAEIVLEAKSPAVTKYTHLFFQRKGPKDDLLDKTNRPDSHDKDMPYVKIVLKRQLNGKELRTHGLKNDINA